MADAAIIDGKAIAATLRAEVARGTADLIRTNGIVPGLTVVLVGSDPASEVYVRNKVRQTAECGMKSHEIRLPEETSEADLLAHIARLNADAAVHGILVQLPLPKHINSGRVLEAIDPAKDVDGFHPVNAGRLATGAPALVPCTPLGCLLLAQSVRPKLAGLEAVVIGRSNIVGKPVAQLLLGADCTVTIAHSRTHNLAGVARRGDLLIAAVGRPEMVRGDWVKPGAIVIDVGINRQTLPNGKSRLVGDVAFDEVRAVAGHVTPVPGGVGPMTIACLLKNTLTAARRFAGLRD
ncbi:MAG TPA: bifunctional methylenetetrahydrofolate dehydrogenase/methenyltetrahydrofolate cyclohydrolase FolD [Hyphomicrobiaceae bacterium]|nr:bifunctional methylenetetrahydrofolate dehydrogenase/methenyltetrahydrofolate cyclohydrolase FolD [Hyphomicrobiaceae bacterium]